ncbi:MAG TPA: DEAD/DEAH box helicase [Thermoguttaceae bacterium]|nr:DEAD/DEAH box helicase [Thermoguttaceae bacterium]
MRFDNLGLVEPILRAVQAEGYQTATPIQVQAIPQVIKGRDLIGCAQTGTGKTAAFALPTLQRLRTKRDGLQEPSSHRRSGNGRKIRALILSPTRELAAQIGESFSAYGRFTDLRHTVVYGGVSQGPQVRALQKGVDTLIATPGRLLDLIGQGYVDLGQVEILTLDEADRMLDMGFIHDLRRIVAHVPRDRQTLMFSATMPDEICQLAAEWLRKPVHVHVAPDAATADKVAQSVYFVEPRQKLLLLSHFLQNTLNTRTLVFSRTKHGADKIVRGLLREGIQAAAIHGNKSQAARQRVLDYFKSDRPPVLVATDVAARGLDVYGISHVINYDMPHDPETYVHRIGRTGRAGATGIAVSFCGRDEQAQLRLIERLIRRTIAVEPQQPEQPRGIRRPAVELPHSEALLQSQPSSGEAPVASKGSPPARRKSRPPRQRRLKSKGSSQEGRHKAATPRGHTANRRRRRVAV